MQNLAPDIVRQRLLVEGFFSIEVDEPVIRQFFKRLTDNLTLRTYGEPTIFAPGGAGRAENEGYDAFIPLIDSGVSLYVWSARKFLALVIFTCKSFDVETATGTTRDFFQLTETAYREF